MSNETDRRSIQGCILRKCRVRSLFTRSAESHSETLGNYCTLSSNGQSSQVRNFNTRRCRHLSSITRHNVLRREDLGNITVFPNQSNLQDHASGNLLVELAGGKVTDMYGNPLDFGRGRTLKSKGVIAAEKSIHSKVIQAVQRVLSESKM